MAIPTSNTTTSTLPQGFESIIIGTGATAITYIVDSVSGPTHSNRIISRTDAKGDRADFMIRDGSDQIEVTYTLQRDKTTTILPQIGFGFGHDYDRSGTASSMIVKDVTVNRDKDSFDTFEMVAVRKTYQG